MATKDNNEVQHKNEIVIILDEPIKRGTETITQISIRKPSAGELRGISLVELGQMNTTALQQVLPRITTPILTMQDVGKLDPADLLEIGVEVAGFLVKKADKAAFQRE